MVHRFYLTNQNAEYENLNNARKQWSISTKGVQEDPPKINVRKPEGNFLVDPSSRN